MTTISLITPIQYSKISNLSFTDYLLIYLDENQKLKRAVPDFCEQFMDYENSLLLEALNADKVSVFKLVRRNKTKYENAPIFYIDINENGEIVNYNNFGDHSVNLENLLLDSKRRQTVAKLLKKRR